MRDRRGRSPEPKLLGEALDGFRGQIAPPTPLAAVQAVWNQSVGSRIAAVAEPVEEHEGVVTVTCESAVWSEELQLMAPRIQAALEDRLGDTAPTSLRFVTEV